MMDNAWRRRTKKTNWNWHYSQNNSRPLKRRCSIYWGNWETLQLDAHQFTKTLSAASESALKPTSDSNTASGIVAATGSVCTGALNNDMLTAKSPICCAIVLFPRNCEKALEIFPQSHASMKRTTQHYYLFITAFAGVFINTYTEANKSITH